MNQLKFKLDPYSVNINLKKRITTLRGDSATGKSFIYELLRSYNTLNPDIKCLCINISNTDKHSLIGKLENLDNSLIVIDHANHFLDSVEVEKFIRKDYKRNNHYLLIGRSLPITSALSEYAEPSIEGNNVSIKYIFEE
ncbi:MAG: hypothetical protein NC548_47095 [Lachnospiraceae bacterium]|nr:hypothetical protein [Lachnospiraceae bacterium]